MAFSYPMMILFYATVCSSLQLSNVVCWLTQFPQKSTQKSIWVEALEYAATGFQEKNSQKQKADMI